MGLLNYLLQCLDVAKKLNLEWEDIMAKATTYEELITKLDEATTKLGEKIKELVAKLEEGGLTKEQEEANLAALDAIGDKLVEMGTDPAEPVPPVE
jgi:Na+/phosphate symporter